VLLVPPSARSHASGAGKRYLAAVTKRRLAVRTPKGQKTLGLDKAMAPDWEDSASSRITERSLYPKFVISGPDLRFRSGSGT